MANTHKQCRPEVIKIALLIVLASNLCAFSYDFAGGTGEPNNPYQIATAEHLLSIGSDPNLLNKNFILINDIDLDPNLSGGQIFDNSLIAFDISDANYFQGTRFSGCFDGNDYKIKNLVINAIGKDWIGLFGIIEGGEVKNLVIEDFYITGESDVGGLCGICENTTISSCHTIGRIESQDAAGGLIGLCMESDITDCSTNCNITGRNDLGGLIGICDMSNVNRSCSFGSVDGQYDIGGLIGWSSYLCNVFNCYSDSSVDGRKYVGGFIGYNYEGYIEVCYSTGHITFSESYGGGFIGELRYSMGKIRNCFWDVEKSGTTDGLGIPGSYAPYIVGKTTEQMKTASTFSTWDFVNTWAICEGTNYPRLQWQIPQTDLLCPDGVDFLDYALFAEHWLEENCGSLNNNCEGCDFDRSGVVDSLDLGELTNDWLRPF